MGLRSIAKLAGTIVALAATGASTLPAAAAPAQSGYLSDVQIDMGTVKKYADESDNYHLTWHSDDKLYGAYGDGWGFVKTAITKRAIGVSRITGTPPSLSGVVAAGAPCFNDVELREAWSDSDRSSVSVLNRIPMT